MSFHRVSESTRVGLIDTLKCNNGEATVVCSDEGRRVLTRLAKETNEGWRDIAKVSFDGHRYNKRTKSDCYVREYTNEKYQMKYRNGYIVNP